MPNTNEPPFHVEHHLTKHTVPRETFSNTDEIISQHHNQLETYLNELLWWNQRINLVSRNVPRETIREHIRHSLLLSQFSAFKEANVSIDAGTGGGLPGIPLALTHPQKHVVLNDLLTKKCLAMKQIAKKLKLKNIGIVDGSIEELSQDEAFVLISKHAFKINDLYEMTTHLPWKKMVLYKGSEFKDELAGIPETLKIDQHDLSGHSEFYNGKAIVVISR